MLRGVGFRRDSSRDCSFVRSFLVAAHWGDLAGVDRAVGLVGFGRTGDDTERRWR